MKLTYFYDIESEEIISSLQLLNEYIENVKSNPSEFNYSFSDYIKNCLHESNGTLRIINEHKIKELLH